MKKIERIRLRSGGLTIVSQIIEHKLGQTVRIVLAGLHKGEKFVCDDFRHRVFNIAFEQERVADLMKGCAHRLDVRRVDLVL